MVYQVAAAYEIDVEQAHLTVMWTRNVTTGTHWHQAKYYSEKSGSARSEVDLPNGID